MNNENVEEINDDSKVKLSVEIPKKYEGLTYEEIRKRMYVKENDDKFMKARMVNRNGILDGLLIPGLYVLAAPSKRGKSMIATAIANCVASGGEYLGKKCEKGSVMYFDNDNYISETSNRVQIQGFDFKDSITYVFGEESKSFKTIKLAIELFNEELPLKLVIIDSLIGVQEYVQLENTYEKIYPILTDFRDYIYKKKIVCIVLHHTKKGDSKRGESFLGTTALTAATSGGIELVLTNRECTRAELEFDLRHITEVIPLRRAENGAGWILGSHDDSNSDIDEDILAIIKKVARSKEHEISGTAQELVAKTGVTFNPVWLLRKLKSFQNVLDENHIKFRTERTSNKRIIYIYSTDYDKDEDTDLKPKNKTVKKKKKDNDTITKKDKNDSMTA